MTSRSFLDQVRRIEAKMDLGGLSSLSDDELDEAINSALVWTCDGYPSVNAAAGAFWVSSNPEDRALSKLLDQHIAYVVEERMAGRIQKGALARATHAGP